MMIVLITPAETNGGILQFSITLANKISQNHDCILFTPNTIGDAELQHLNIGYIKYQRVKTLNIFDKSICDISNSIELLNPDLVIFLEDILMMQQINWHLKKKEIKTAIVIHDINSHPTNNFAPRKVVVEYIRQFADRISVNVADFIIVLSENSKKIFQSKYKKHKSKVVLLRLGAHLPNELISEKNNNLFDKKYFLFFGRIDKYKGLISLLKAYCSLNECYKNEWYLVIAGRGILSEEEKELIDNEKNIVLMNRFISDEEMVDLFKETKVVVLPYLEASQSGVLPISYHFNKPVIVRNIPGLKENIDEGVTGFIFDDDFQLGEILKSFCNNSIRVDRKKINEFYNQNFNWTENIEKALNDMDVYK